MAFDRQYIAARLALGEIRPLQCLAWEALEADVDGPAILRLAAADEPFSEYERLVVFPQAIQQMGLPSLTAAEAASVLARRKASEILEQGLDPLLYTSEFYGLWSQSGYCEELSGIGSASDGVDDNLALEGEWSGISREELRDWMPVELRKLVAK
jgi:hypothetical protein